MGVFAKYRRFYVEPERISPENARLNRINSALQRETEFRSRLSPATLEVLERTRRVLKDAQVGRPKAETISAALDMFEERHFADPQLRTAYRELRTLQNYGPLMATRREASQEASKGGQRKVRGFAPDFRSFWPHTEAAFDVTGNPVRFTKFLFGTSWMPMFKHAQSVVPCIERWVRREVMFAKKKAGRGYKVKHRQRWHSGVPC